MLDLLLVYACVATLSAGIATGTYRTVRRFSGAADSTTFVREMNSIGINATDVAKLVNADITSLFDLVKKKPNFVQNIGFSKPNAKALLKAAKKLKAFGDGQIKKYKKKEKQLQNKVERMGMVYTPLSLAPTFSFYDLNADHALVFGNYETLGVNLKGDLRKSHTDLAPGKNYREHIRSPVFVGLVFCRLFFVVVDSFFFLSTFIVTATVAIIICCCLLSQSGPFISDVWNIFAETIGRPVFDTIHIWNIIPYAMKYGSKSKLWTNDKLRQQIKKLQLQLLDILSEGHANGQFSVLGCFGRDAQDWWVVCCMYDVCMFCTI